MRSTISSNALFEGAHTKTFVRRYDSSPTISAFSAGGGAGSGASRRSGGASRGFEAPASHGMTRLCAAAFSDGARGLRSSRLSKKRLRSSSWPLDAPGTACNITLRRERMMRVLPVPGGPWISVIGCFSSAARSAVSCDSANGEGDLNGSRGRRQRRFSANLAIAVARCTVEKPTRQRLLMLRETTYLLRNHGRS